MKSSKILPSNNSGLILLINLLIILTTLLINVKSQIVDCDTFKEELKTTCRIMKSGVNNTRDPNLPPGSGDVPSDRFEFQCFNLSCLCFAFNGVSNGQDCTLPDGSKLEKCIRKEIRMLSDEERETYFAAVKQLKKNLDFDIAATIHKVAWESAAAHNGPGFFPWHREYLKMYEIMIREALYQIRNSTKICLPYWDSTLDKQLPVPKDSYLFTADFYGSTNSLNQVIDGPFTPWETIENEPYIRRRLGRDGSCYSENDISWELAQTNVTNILAFTMPMNNFCPYQTDSGYPEYPHGAVHTFVGGLMANPSTAANDPLFHSHHCFVDLTWELWRNLRQTRIQRINDYPPDNMDCSHPIHFKNEKMSQFPYIKNIDGCRNEYTDNLYEYALRPSCTFKNPDCGSKYLFCDLSHGSSPHCAGKVKLGGSCIGFSKGEQVCYNGQCVNNICVVPKSTTSSTPSTLNETSSTSTQTLSTSIETFNTTTITLSTITTLLPISTETPSSTSTDTSSTSVQTENPSTISTLPSSTEIPSNITETSSTITEIFPTTTETSPPSTTCKQKYAKEDEVNDD